MEPAGGLGAMAPQMEEERGVERSAKAIVSLTEGILNPIGCCTRCAYTVVKTRFCINVSQLGGLLAALAGFVGMIAAGFFNVDWRIGAMGGLGFVFGSLLFMYARGTKGMDEVIKGMRQNVMRMREALDQFDKHNRQLSEEIKRMSTQNKALGETVVRLEDRVQAMGQFSREIASATATLAESTVGFSEFVSELESVRRQHQTMCEELQKATRALADKVQLVAERDQYRQRLEEVQKQLEALSTQRA